MDERIRTDIERAYGIRVMEALPIRGGFLNELCRIKTDKGDLLMKRYSRERYREPWRIEEIEKALQTQRALRENGVKSPRIELCGGRAIRVLEDGTAYMLMEYIEGRNETQDTITNAQMRDLGEACARMKAAYSAISPIGAKGYPIDSEAMYRALWVNFETRAGAIPPGAPEGYEAAVLSQKPILESLSPAFFERLPKGMAHEDFTSDNLLFDEKGVLAIIDFDRTCYSYIWHDIGRAILCFALCGGELRADRIAAFRDGYAAVAPLTRENIADALRVSFCIETLWWIQPEYFRMEPCKAARFLEEILWLGERWFDIDSLLLGV